MRKINFCLSLKFIESTYKTKPSAVSVWVSVPIFRSVLSRILKLISIKNLTQYWPKKKNRNSNRNSRWICLMWPAILHSPFYQGWIGLAELYMSSHSSKLKSPNENLFWKIIGPSLRNTTPWSSFDGPEILAHFLGQKGWIGWAWLAGPSKGHNFGNFTSINCCSTFKKVSNKAKLLQDIRENRTEFNSPQLLQFLALIRVGGCN